MAADAQQAVPGGIAWGVIVATAVVVPLAMSNVTLRGATQPTIGTWDIFEGVKTYLLHVLAVVAVGTWAFHALLRGTMVIRWVSGTWLLVAFLGWAAVSTLLSVHWPTALLGTYRRHDGWLAQVAYAAVFLTTLQFAHDAARRRLLAVAATATASLVAVYAVAQTAGADPLEWGALMYERQRAFSTIGNPVALGSYFALILPPAAALALTAERARGRLAAWSAVLLLACGLVVTFSRGAWIGGIVGLAIVAAGTGWRSVRRRRELVAVLIALSTAVTAIAIATRGATDVTNVLARAASIANPEDESAHTRLLIWRTAVDAIALRPVAGFGLDTFRLVFPAQKPAEYVRKVGHRGVADNAHNHPLHVAAGTGIPGALLLYAFFAWIAVRSAPHAFGSARDPSGGNVMLLGYWAGCAGYLASLMFGVATPGTMALQWIFLGVLVAPLARTVAVPVARGGNIAAVAVLVLGIVAVGLWSRWLVADHHVAVAQTARDYKAKLAAIDEAVRLNPLEMHHRTLAGTIRKDLFALGLQQASDAHASGRDARPYQEVARRAQREAAASLLEAIAHAPVEYDNHVALASLYNMSGNAFGDAAYFDDAIGVATRGIALSPFGPALRYELAWAYARTDRVPLALVELQRAHSLDPGYVDCALGLAQLYMDAQRYDSAIDVLNAALKRHPGHRTLVDTLAVAKGRRADQASPSPR